MTATTSSSNDGGFTLIEVLIALLVMIVGLLGLLQAVIVALDFDTRNVLREESVHLADEEMSAFRRTAFASSANSGTETKTVSRQIRGGTRNYTVVREYLQAGSSTRRLLVRVTWKYKGAQWQHEIYTLRSNR